MFVAWSGLLSWVQITDVGRSLYIGSFCPAMISLSRCLEEAAFSISISSSVLILCVNAEIKKNRNENGNRADVFRSSPHSNGEDFFSIFN